MLITKFNKLIKSKFVLTCFAFLICFSFVGIGVLSSLQKNDSSPDAAGELFGNKISSQDFRNATLFELDLNRTIRLSEEQQSYLREMAWERLAAIEYAKKSNIGVSRSEVIAQLNARSIDQDTFRNIAKQNNVTDTQLTEYMIQSATLQKLGAITSSSVWISPSESRQRSSHFLDKLNVEFTIVDPKTVLKEEEVPEEDVKKYFEDNIEMFMIPEKVSVRYITFPASDYSKDVTISDADVKAYYEKNIDDYSVPGTNDTTVSTPLDEVKDEIKSALTLKASIEKAASAATDAVTKMAPTRYGPGVGFERAAKAVGKEIMISKPFAEGDDPEGIDAGAKFSTTAFSLPSMKEDKDHYFSDPITGVSNVYVAASHTRTEKTKPAYEDVKDEVKPYAEDLFKRQSIKKKAEEIRDELAKQEKAGTDFSAAVQSFGLNVSTSGTFTVFDTMFTNKFEYSSTIAREVSTLAKGELSDVINVMGGDIVIAKLTDREPADALSLQTIRPQILQRLEGERTEMLFRAWRKQNLKEAGMVDYMEERMKKIKEMEAAELKKEAEEAAK